MKVLKFNELFKFYPEKSREENAKILRDKIFKQQKNESDVVSYLVVVNFRKDKLDYSQTPVGNYRDIDIEEDIKQEIQQRDKWKKIEYAYILKKTTTTNYEMSEDILDKYRTIIDAEKYNL